ncbi:hypothetical protein [Streptomyces celluloflavus]|uniref:hypothetical protein n=1 Tax=Streptomyces celluloflavus TaxID=58344 RepID=UPI0036B47CB3
MYAALALTIGASGLAAPSASAASAAAPAPKLPSVSVLGELDSLGVTPVPTAYRGQLPTVTGQLMGLQHLHDLSELHQLTDLVAPVTGLLPTLA